MKVDSRLLCLLPVVGFLIVASFSEAGAQESPQRSAGALDDGKAKLWKSLSAEEQDKLKQALRSVWSDPAVISARDEVQQSSDAYHKAVKAAINRADPSAAKVLGKLHSLSGGSPGERKGDRRGPGFPFPPRGERSIGESMGFPAAMADFSDEEKAQFREAESQARESATVKKILTQLESTREEDDAIRKKKFELFRKLRMTMFAEMVKIDPEVEALVAKLRPVSGPREGGKGAAGKGPGRPPGGKEGRKRPESE